jgi:hypothetical protein
MTKQEFEKKAMDFGYTDGWIKNAIEKMKNLNNKYGFEYSYEDIILHKADNKENSKFFWNGNEAIIFKPKKKK